MTIELLPAPLRRAVSPYTGIVRALEECLPASDEPKLFRAACEASGLTGIGGAGITRADAAAAAIGEALERYSASQVPLDRLRRATARELAGTVAPERFALFSESQHQSSGFPFRQFDSDTRIPWIEGRALPGGDRFWLPAELVFLSPVEDERPIGYATSSGTACAESIDEAIARGLCELLERDAFMLAWTNRLSLPRLDWSGDARLLALDRRYFRQTGLEYAAIDLSGVHEVPSFLGVVRGPKHAPGALGVGAGTAATVDRAWWKSLSEAFAARTAGVKLARVEERDLGAAGEGIASFEDHIRWYANHEHAAAASFLDASADRRDVREIAELRGDPIPRLLERVEAAGSSAYFVDVTSPDVAELGLHVTKVVAPELCALDVPHAARFLGGRRLYEAAAQLGLRGTPLQELDVNPHPHPFP